MGVLNDYELDDNCGAMDALRIGFPGGRGPNAREWVPTACRCCEHGIIWMIMQTVAAEQRSTRQKAAIRSAFENAGRPLSAQQALEIAQADVKRLGIAAVYRNIRTLLADGWLSAVELPGEVPAYELSGKQHHHHFRCDKCSRVFDLKGCVEHINKLAVPGFRVRSHYIVLYGLCGRCRRTG
jgi:Fur family transcriptional regulator, ferric uptake regulator